MPIRLYPQLNTIARWGEITGELVNQADLKNLLESKSETSHTHLSEFETLDGWLLKGIPFYTHSGAKFLISAESYKIPFMSTFELPVSNISLINNKTPLYNSANTLFLLSLSERNIPFYKSDGSGCFIGLVA